MRPTLVIVAVLGAVVSAWAFDGMTPELAAHLETLAPGEPARVNVIMAERYDLSRMASVTAGLTRAERRAVVVGELKGYAERTQRDVLALLADAERERVTFNFSIPYDDRRAELAVFDIAGRRVATVVRGARAGANAAAWSLVDARGRPVPPGVYVCRLTSAAGSAARRVAVVR